MALSACIHNSLMILKTLISWCFERGFPCSQISCGRGNPQWRNPGSTLQFQDDLPLDTRDSFVLILRTSCDRFSGTNVVKTMKRRTSQFYLVRFPGHSFATSGTPNFPPNVSPINALSIEKKIRHRLHSAAALPRHEKSSCSKALLHALKPWTFGKDIAFQKSLYVKKSKWDTARESLKEESVFHWTVGKSEAVYMTTLDISIYGFWSYAFRQTIPRIY